MNKTGKIFLFLAIFSLFAIFSNSLMAMSSTNYIINWDSINIGGTDFSSSTNYYLHDTLGEISTGRSSSTNYWIYAGYRQGLTDDTFLQFKIRAQQETSKISYTAFDNASNQVTLSDSTGYAINDYITVVENLGSSQLIAIGKITNVAGNVITVDKWDGDNGAINPSPAGGDDYVYKLFGHALELGYLDNATVNTGVSFNEVSTTAWNGYTVTVRENHNLAYGPFDIDDVSDGTVNAGSEEYGIETVGDRASGAGDFSIDSAGKTVQSSTTNANQDRIGVIYKASIDSSTQGGGYSHTVSYYVTANF